MACEIELKPCPFCGGKAEISEGAIYCPVCEISFSNEREKGAVFSFTGIWTAKLWNLTTGKAFHLGKRRGTR